MVDSVSEGAGPPDAAEELRLSFSQSRTQVGKWVVNPEFDEISSQGRAIKLEPRTMRLLLYLMEHRDRVVAQKELLDNVWANVVVTPQSVYSTIAQLRHALDDSADSPTYIATVPRKGYRLLATVTKSPTPAAVTTSVTPTTRTPATPEEVAAPSAALPAAQAAPSGPPRSSWRPGWVIALLATALGTVILVYRVQYRQPQLPAAGAAPVPSIAVLPFLDLSEKQNSPYLADGMTEELIDMLAHNTALRVPARTSSFYFKGKTETVATIARQLNVTHLLEGSVRRADGKIRVTAQLIRAADGFHIWSETYTREGDDVLAVEDDIAQAVARTLGARLTPIGNPAVADRADSAVHSLAVECRFYRERNTSADADKAIECFRRLIDMNVQSAPAWAGYADMLMRQPMLSGAAIDVQRAAGIESVKAARRALALDRNCAAAHAVIANFLRIFAHDWGGADSEIKAALAADPGDSPTLLAATGLARDLGHLDEFVRLCARAQAHDPLNFQPYARLGEAYLYLGRLEEAETMARRRLDLSPDGNGSRAQLAEVLLARGQLRAALEEISHEPLDYLRKSGYAMAYHALGRNAEADEVLAELIAEFAQRQPTHIAEIFAFRGDIDRAFEFLDQAAASGDRNLLSIKSNYYFRNLHADPRYQAVLRRLSLPDDP